MLDSLPPEANEEPLSSTPLPVYTTNKFQSLKIFLSYNLRKPKFILNVVVVIVLLVFGGYFVTAKIIDRTQDLRSKAALPDSQLNNWTFVVGPEEIIYGPNRYPDTAFHTLKSNNTLKAYMSRENTYVFEGSSVTDLKLKGISMQKGTTGSADDKGRWLLSTYKVSDNRIIGWYHSEHFVASTNKKEIAYAESSDGGVTWTYPNFPNNRVITNDVAFADKFSNHHTGDGNVIVVDGYFYLFYRSTGPKLQTEIARSALSDLGKPGTWKKYYCKNSNDKATCAFTEPGIGGKATGISGLPTGSTRVIYNKALKRFVYSAADEKAGFKLYISEPDDLLTWKEQVLLTPTISDPSDPTLNNWLRYGADAPSLKQWTAYASILSMNEIEEPIDHEFYLYYAKVYPQENHEKIYLARRKVTLEESKLWNNQSAVVALSEYKNSKTNDTWVTIEAPKPESGYIFTKILGYTLPIASKDRESRLLSDCYAAVWDNYFLVPSIDPHVKWTQCEIPGNKFSSHIGYVYSQPQDNTISLYRCFNRTNLDHYVSVGNVCGNESEESHLFGYMLQRSNGIQVSPSPSTLPLSTPTSTIVPDSASTQNARFVSYNNVPNSLRVGEKATISVTMQNTGTVSWKNENGYLLGDNEANGVVWNVGRVRIPNGETVAPNQSVTFSITLTAPSVPGVYPLEWQMLQQRVRWFGEISQAKSITVVQ